MYLTAQRNVDRLRLQDRRQGNDIGSGCVVIETTIEYQKNNGQSELINRYALPCATEYPLADSPWYEINVGSHGTRPGRIAAATPARSEQKQAAQQETYQRYRIPYRFSHDC